MAKPKPRPICNECVACDGADMADHRIMCSACEDAIRRRIKRGVIYKGERYAEIVRTTRPDRAYKDDGRVEP